jgi:MerR family copper efflux transcriptional regulator
MYILYRRVAGHSKNRFPLASTMKMDGGNYTIGEFAKLSGLSPRTVDFYTRQGLLRPQQPGRNHGYRHYTEEDRRRVSLIKQLQAKKFSLQEIRRAMEMSGKKNAVSPAEIMEQVTLELERLQSAIEEIRPSAPVLGQPVMRAVATEALQKATALCSVLVTILQDMPLL